MRYSLLPLIICYVIVLPFFILTDENFKLDSAKMLAEQAYVIFLILRKGERRSLGYQVLELVNGLPPELGIEYVVYYL